jgi:arylsulfatase A-like enzyme
MKKLGIVPENIKLSKPEDDPTTIFRPRSDGHDEMRHLMSIYTPWDDLTAEQQAQFSLEMAVYAAMIDRMDQNIGRIIQELKDKGIEDNTIIMYFSDNGACPFERNRDLIIPPGGADSWRTLSTCWANVGNTPYRYYKQNGHDGGSHNHFIVSWPDVIKPGKISNELTQVVDIFPTLLDITGIPYPSHIKEETTIPLNGSSLLPVFKGHDRKDPDFIMSGFTENKRMFRKGEWQIVKLNGGDWELYNLKEDPTEIINLASTKPDVLETMVKSYYDYKANTEFILKKEIRRIKYPYQIPGGGLGIPPQKLPGQGNPGQEMENLPRPYHGSDGD